MTDPHVLREYALLADGERGALVGPRGDIVWMCAPRWDSGSVFSALLGGAGCYEVQPRGRFVWGGFYEDDTMIWRSRWVTETGIVECREALAYPGNPGLAVLLRRVHALDGGARLDVVLRPRADYDRVGITDLRHADGQWTMRSGDLRLRWTCGSGARSGDGALTMALDLAPGEYRDLVLEIGTGPLDDPLGSIDELWDATEVNWRSAVPALEQTVIPRDTRRSYAVLRGLTGRSGGMVAAATTSLPERSDAGRNYDYRYVWIRDQCYAGQAAAACGADDLLDAAVGYVTARLLEYGPRLAPAYTLSGEPIPSPRSLPLPGYPGGSDVVGNQVNSQFQLDGPGEALLLLATADGCGRLDDEGWRAAEVAAETIAKRWTEPDAGIWEIDDRPWTHSRLTAAAGLRAMAARRLGRISSDWLALADHIVADTAAHALHPEGHWQRSPDDPALDASLLLVGLRGGVPVDDPRTRATLHAYLRDLTVDGYAYRFRHDDRPLADAEGSFLLCGFLVALSHLAQGDAVQAHSWFERTRAACGPPELFSEEFDSRQHQMRGNLPQAFVHALMIETAARLAR